MGNSLICRNVSSQDIRQASYGSRAHELLQKLIDTGHAAKQSDSLTEFLQVLSDLVHPTLLIQFLLRNMDQWDVTLKSLKFEHIKYWMALHPQAFDMIIKDLNMESTVHWNQFKSELLTKMRQHQDIGSRPSLTPSLKSTQDMASVVSIRKSGHMSHNNSGSMGLMGGVVGNASGPNLPQLPKLEKDMRPHSASFVSAAKITKRSANTSAHDPVAAYCAATKCIVSTVSSSPDSIVDELLRQIMNISEAYSVTYLHAAKSTFDMRIQLTARDGQPHYIDRMEKTFPNAGIAGDTWLLQELCRTTTEDPKYSPAVDGPCPFNNSNITSFANTFENIEGVILVFHSADSALSGLKEKDSVVLHSLVEVANECLKVAGELSLVEVESRMTEMLLDYSIELAKARSTSQAIVTIQNTSQLICGSISSNVFMAHQPTTIVDDFVKKSFANNEIVLSRDNFKIAIPVISKTQTLAVIVVDAADGLNFHDSDVALLRSFMVCTTEVLAGLDFLAFDIKEYAKSIFDSPNIFAILQSLLLWIKSTLECREVLLYVEKKMISPQLQENLLLLPVEEQSGIVSYTYSSKTCHVDNADVPHIYHEVTNEKFRNSMCIPFMYDGSCIGVLECVPEDGLAIADRDRDLATEILSQVSTRLVNVLERERMKLIRRYHGIVNDIMSGSLDSFKKDTSFSGKDVVISRESSRLISDISRLPILEHPQHSNKSGTSTLINHVAFLNQNYRLELDTSLINEFIEQLVRQKRPYELLMCSDRLQFMTYFFEKTSCFKFGWLTKSDIVALLFGSLCCEDRFLTDDSAPIWGPPNMSRIIRTSLASGGSQPRRKSYNNVTLTTAPTSTGSNYNMMRMFASFDTTLFARYTERDLKTVFTLLRDLDRSSSRAEASKLLGKFDAIMAPFVRQEEGEDAAFEQFFSPGEMLEQQRLFVNLLHICLMNSTRTRNWNIMSKWIQVSVKEMPMINEQSGLKARYSAELSLLDMIVIPCFEMMALIFQNAVEDVAKQGAEVCEKLFEQIMENRQHLAEGVDTDDSRGNSSEDSFWAEEVSFGSRG